MYAPFQLARKYLAFYWKAASAKGHGVHSPFVFDFIRNVKNDRTEYPRYREIEAMRVKMLRDTRTIAVEDFGAGSGHVHGRTRPVSAIAATSLKPKKFARLLHRIVQHYNCKKVLELGTSLGVTTSYLAAARNQPVITTIEGSPAIAAIAAENFKSLELPNIKLHVGEFEKTLHTAVEETGFPDLIFIDGNHRKEPTLRYFDQLLAHSKEDTIMVFDDVHWSEEMEAAWEIIKSHKAVTLSIDLFFIGIIFLRKDFKVKQAYRLRF